MEDGIPDELIVFARREADAHLNAQSTTGLIDWGHYAHNYQVSGDALVRAAEEAQVRPDEVAIAAAYL